MDICLRFADKNVKNYYGMDIIYEVFQDPNCINISSGINKLKIPSLYEKYIEHQLKHNPIFTDYNTEGNYSLLMCLKTYEKLIASGNCKINNMYADNLSITIGATQAVKYLFDYYKEHYGAYDVLLIGFNFYLFYKCCETNNLNYYELISSSGNRVAPTLREIEAAVNQINAKMLVLTLPLNPSGECYTENEVRKIVEIARQKEMVVCFDKCQLDEFANTFKYINIGEILLESDYIDNAIVINSQSKIRSVPGLRSGYIIASDKQMLQYVKNRREEEIYCPPTYCIAALIIDLIFRVVRYGESLLKEEYRFSRVIRIFKNAIQMSYDNKNNKNYLLSLLNEEELYKDYLEFKEELEKNWQTVKENYAFVKKIFKDDLIAITSLEGGFNFCIKLKQTEGHSQKDFLKKVLDATGIQLLSEDFFTLYPLQNKLPFWIRISAAEEGELFRRNILKLKEFIDTLG